MMEQDSTSASQFYTYIFDFSVWIKVYSIILSVIAAIKLTQRFVQLWQTRNLRKVWGIENGENVLVICSELDEPEIRQNPEEREFIYNLKYGDVDAYFEVIVTLLRLYPKLKLRVLSSGEAENSQIDLAKQTVILIGGPDYNSYVQQFLVDGFTQFEYRSPYVEYKSTQFPNEISIFHKSQNKEYCTTSLNKDFGYFERINNPNNSKKKVILIGGCHTIGVTAAVKAFSLKDNEYGEVVNTVFENSKKVAKKICKNSEFAVLVHAKKNGQSINTPVINDDEITLL